MGKVLFYWGCWKEAGHFLWSRGGQRLRDDRWACERLLIPSADQLDATVLFLPQPEKVGMGALTYLSGPDRTILAWWGNPWDKRGKVNSALITEGFADIDYMWREFHSQFPEIAGEIVMPTPQAR